MIRHESIAGPSDTAASRPHSLPPLVILGASARALARSAAQAGWEPYAADLFCDLDLQATARQAVQVSAGYPSSLASAAAGFPSAAPWCYTGALENHPDLVDRIAKTRPLAGNAGAILRRLREPVRYSRRPPPRGWRFRKRCSRRGDCPKTARFS
ncbi:MAG: hypothetical protein ACKOWG_09790 [Planctomycetia bacterium]